MSEPFLRFVHLTDTHLNPDPHYLHPHAPFHPYKGAEAAVHAINHLPFDVDFVLHTGDVVYDPVPAAYPGARDVFALLKPPIYYLPGNHDERNGLQRELIGHEPAHEMYYHTFEAGGVQIICLDSTGPATPPAGSLGADQLAWLDALCAADDPRPLVVAMHHNAAIVGVPWLDIAMRVTDADALHSILLKARHRLRGVFFGHIHQAMTIYQEGILYSSAPSTWYQLDGYPGETEPHAETAVQPGFHVVTITRDQTLIRHYRLHVS